MHIARALGGGGGSFIRRSLIPRIIFKTKQNLLDVHTALKLAGRNKITPHPILVQGNARALPASSPELEDQKYALACF